MWHDTYVVFGLLAFSCKPNIKEKLKELGFNLWNTVYYQKKGTNGNSMIKLIKDSCATKMLEEFETYLAKNRICVATWTRWHGPTCQNARIL
jgi:hypothetical protein